MLVDLSDVFSSRKNHIHTEEEFEEEYFVLGKKRIPVIEKNPLVLDISFVEKNRAMVTGSTELVFDTVCDRCLKETPTRLEISVNETVVSPDMEGSFEEGRQYMEGFKLNVEALFFNEISLNWPAKILCRDDCKGLCLKCGKSLNEGDCGCDRFVPDPRMAHIKDVFDAYHGNKEE